MITLSRIGKNSLIYGLGTALRNVTSLIMLPIYTSYLSTSDYGAVELLTMALNFISLIMGMRLAQAMFRFYSLESDENKKNCIVSTTLLSVSGLGVLFALLSIAFSESFVELLFGSNSYLLEFRLFVFTLVTTAVIQTAMTYFQVRQQPVQYVIYSSGYLFLQVVLNIYFVVLLELHVLGVVYGALSSGLIMSFILFVVLVKKVGMKFSVRLFFRMWEFILPLMLASMAGFYAAYADKYFIRLFDGLAAVGLYALAYRLSSIVSTLYATFNQSWSAARFDIYKSDKNSRLFSRVYKYMNLGLVVFGTVVAIFSKDVIYYMTDQSFHGAIGLVPLFVVVVIVNSHMSFFNLGIMISKRTGYIALASLVKALISTVLYIIMIPKYGVYGAVVGLLISSLAETLIVYLSSTRLFNMRLEHGPVLLMYVTAGVFWVIENIISEDITGFGLSGFFSRSLILLIFILVLYRLPIWPDGERDLLKNLLSLMVKVVRRKVYG